MLSLWRGTLHNTSNRNLALLHESLLMQGYGIYWSLGWFLKRFVSQCCSNVWTCSKVMNPICILMHLSCIFKSHLNINDYSLINVLIFFSSYLHFVFIYSYFKQVIFFWKIYYLLSHLSRFANNVQKYPIEVHSPTSILYQK